LSGTLAVGGTRSSPGDPVRPARMRSLWNERGVRAAALVGFRDQDVGRRGAISDRGPAACDGSASPPRAPAAPASPARAQQRA